MKINHKYLIIRSIIYGLGAIFTEIKFVLQESELAHFKIFDKNGKKILL